MINHNGDSWRGMNQRLLGPNRTDSRKVPKQCWARKKIAPLMCRCEWIITRDDAFFHFLWLCKVIHDRASYGIPSLLVKASWFVRCIMFSLFLHFNLIELHPHLLTISIHAHEHIRELDVHIGARSFHVAFGHQILTFLDGWKQKQTCFEALHGWRLVNRQNMADDLDGSWLPGMDEWFGLYWWLWIGLSWSAANAGEAGT